MNCYKMFARLSVAMIAVIFMQCLEASPSVTITKVAQRWPWNNKLDITYTVSDGQNIAEKEYYKLRFTAIIDGKTFVFDGMTNMCAKADTGTHTATCSLPKGIKSSDCTMVASILKSDVASGDDYMIINLDTGDVVYEGLMSTQSESNKRYNTDDYKNKFLVLRKVPCGSYQTGHEDYNGSNTPRVWNTNFDYYIGVFPVTQGQYTRICDVNPSSWKAKTGSINDDNMLPLRPVETVTWYDIRGNGATPNDEIKASPDGTFLERLNALTGMVGFDLPTEVMAEIALRAGTTGEFSWGDENAVDYAIGMENNSSKTNKGQHMPVGMLNPNNWGLYDTSGNVYEYCRDDGSLTDLASAVDPWTPACSGSITSVRRRGGGNCRDTVSGNAYKASNRATQAPDKPSWGIGFRISIVIR